MKVESLLFKLKNAQGKIEVVNGDLEIKITKDQKHSYLLNQLKSRKKEVIEFLSDTRFPVEKKCIKNLVPIEEQTYYGTTERQRIEWYLHIKSNKKRQSNISFTKYLYQANLEAIEKTFKALIQLHESLRTTFFTINGALKQVIHDAKTYNFSIEHFDKRNNTDEELNIFIKNMIKAQLDFENGPLLRVMLIQLGNARHVLVFVINHIIFDRASLKILQNDFSKYYNFFENNKTFPLEALKFQMKDYAAWESKFFKSKKGKGNLDYWKKELADNFGMFRLPKVWRAKENVQNPGQKFNGGIYHLAINSKLLNKISDLSYRLRVTQTAFFLASLFILLYAISRHKDIIIATQFSMRHEKEFKRLIGYLTTGLYFRIQIDNKLTIKNFLSLVGSKYFNGLERRIYPVRALEASVDKYCTAILDYQSVDFYDLDTIQNFKCKHEDVETAPHYPFTCKMSVYENGLEISCHYNRNVYDKAGIPKIFDKYIDLLNKIVSSPEERICDILD